MHVRTQHALIALAVPAALLVLPAPSRLAAQREPVLRQISVPHSYYYREMYVPQVTSGPSAATWSPDGAELIYSMQGSLWRQRLDSRVATQLTADGCYDYQPDWSPNGLFVVFASYCNDAIELRLLDLSADEVRPLTSNGAVNIDPRWSPDGRRIAFVSTAHNQRWHIHTLGITRDGAPGTIERLTDDHDSAELKRYYYSRWDHFLSPDWSPDGSEMVFVSNRGRIHGTGGFWRMRSARRGEADGGGAREIRYEETTWKAHPDWSPDGKRIVYSSYLGRQWHQLWLMTSEGGDPFPLTYGEFDATMPRWSPDGRRIAFISNEGGNTSLRIVDVVGGRQRRVDAAERRYRGSVGRVDLRVVDATSGRPVSARVSIVDADGKAYAPDSAWRHADEAFVRSERKFEYGYFHSDGTDRVIVPSGALVVEVWRGPEYRAARHEVRVGPDSTRQLRVAPERIADLPRRGWRSGDLHVHMNYGGAYRNTPRYLAFQAAAEGLDVVENLVVNKEQRIPDIGYFRVDPDPVSTADFLLMHGQEYHTSVWGHMALLGLGDHYVLPDYAGYVNTAAASLYPDNAEIARIAHAQGALVGYVHPFDSRPDPFNENEPLSYAMPIDVALGVMDYFEVMGFSDHLITSEIWYRLLNCGFRIPAGAGTDAFPNFASLRGPVGLLRTYVKLGGPLDHRRWLDGIKAGRTFVTNAPLVEFTLDARDPGSVINIGRGPHTLLANVTLRSNVAVDHLEIIGNGKVVATIPLAANRRAATASVPVLVEQSGWYLVRAWSDKPTSPVLDLYPFATTSPVYVQVGDTPVRSREDAEFFLKWVDRVDAAARAHPAWNTPAERDEVLGRIGRAREVFRDRRDSNR